MRASLTGINTLGQGLGILCRSLEALHLFAEIVQLSECRVADGDAERAVTVASNRVRGDKTIIGVLEGGLRNTCRIALGIPGVLS